MRVLIDDLVSKTRELASLPEVVMRAVDMINDPDTSASDIGRVVSEDAALTTRLLRVVNSPFYGFPSRIETISRAITVIGILELLDLILATSVVKAFSGVPNKLMNMDDFWEHSLYTGVVSRILAAKHRAPDIERYFVAGLLHDIGSLVLYRQLPKQSQTALERARDGKEVLHDVEYDVFGFDHAQVGAALLRSWNLPDSLVATTEFHHRPSRTQNFALETAVVHIADIIATAAEGSRTETGRVPPFEVGAWELTGLNVEILESVLAEADAQFTEARAFLLPNASAA